VLKNMPPIAAPLTKTMPLTPAATTMASTLPDQGCALNWQHGQPEQQLHMQPSPASTKSQLSCLLIFPATPLLNPSSPSGPCPSKSICPYPSYWPSAKSGANQWQKSSCQQ
jgi:hypothetical protein